MGKFVKRSIAAVLALTMTVLLPAVSVNAEPQPEAADTASQQTELSDFEKQKQASYNTVPETNNIDGWPEGPKVYGDSAIVMDMDSGAILYGKKIDERHYPASITKLLTVLIALENSSMDDEVVMSQESIDILRSDYASIGMRPGEIISMKDALYATLFASANEAAYAVGENVGKMMSGDYSTFIQEMNDRSAELGCTGSHWTNANGIHDEAHYTTAHDMALITSELYKHEEFREIEQSLSYTIGPTNMVNEQRVFQQHHKMLWPENQNYYEYCTGGKTGYTDAARTTLVTTADNGTLRLAAVVLQDDGDVYGDTRAMFDYAFGNFSKVMLNGEEKPDGIRSYVKNDAYVLLPEGADFGSLEEKITVQDEREASGRVTFYYQGQNVGSADVTLTPEYIEAATGYSTRLRPAGGEEGTGGAAAEEKTVDVSVPVPLAAAAGILILVALGITIYGIAGHFAAVNRKHGRIKKRRKSKRKK